jgi:hypothetical protein
MTMHFTPKLAAAAAAGTLLLGSAAAVAATASPSGSPANDTVHVWVTPGKGAVDKILLTGAIGDYGTATSTTKSGKVDKNGYYVHIHLQRGTFVVNAVAFNKKASSTPPTVDKSTCSFWETLKGRVTVSDGTGAYAGIQGKVYITTSFAAVYPRHANGPNKGHCKAGAHVKPLKTFDGQIIGAGPVTFTG